MPMQMAMDKLDNTESTTEPNTDGDNITRLPRHRQG